jgi:hypothetical protein
MDPTMTELDPEDAKILTLARGARARNDAREGAAVRDTTGRTYVAIPVDLPSLKLSALQVAIAMAVASGAGALEAAAVVRGTVDSGDSGDSVDSGELGLAEDELAAALDLKTAAVLLADPDAAPPDWNGVRRLV